MYVFDTSSYSLQACNARGTFHSFARSQRTNGYNLEITTKVFRIMSSDEFPHPNGMPTFWTEGDSDIENIRSTDDLPSESTIVIVGGGYSAASLVTHILESYPDHPSVVVIEARQLCSGATGRNGNQGPSSISPISNIITRISSLISDGL